MNIHPKIKALTDRMCLFYLRVYQGTGMDGRCNIMPWIQHCTQDMSDCTQNLGLKDLVFELNFMDANVCNVNIIEYCRRYY